MDRRRTPWWLLLILILLMALILTWLFGDTIQLYIAPKVVLTKAISNVSTQLQTRFVDDPLLLLR